MYKYCLENVENSISKHLNFRIFCGSMPPDPLLGSSGLRRSESRLPPTFSVGTSTSKLIDSTDQMASRLTTIPSFLSVFFQLLQYSRQHPSFSALWAALMTKTDLTFPAFSARFLDFAVQFCSHCKFSFMRL